MITIEVDIEELIVLRRNLATIPIRDFLKDLMKEAKQIVQSAYRTQGSGNANFKVSYRTTKKNTATLTVSGSDVGFLEFGAGVGTEPDDFVDEVDFPVVAGSYSLEHGKFFSNLGFWYYQKVRYEEITATHGMQQALDYLRIHFVEEMRKKILNWIINGK